MIEDKDNWEDIVSNWQQPDVSEMKGEQSAVSKLPSNQELIARVMSDARHGVIETVLMIILYLAFSGYVLMEIIQGLPSLLDYVLYVFFWLLTLIAGFYTVWFRRNTWRSRGDNSKDYVALLLRRANARVKLINMSKRLSIACLFPAISILVFILGMWLTGQEMNPKHVFVSIAIGVGSLFIIGGYFQLKKQSLIAIASQQQLQSMLRAMS